ncbi:MAG: hypothetical protein WAV38_02605 [Xanthobacteraceae bacterium]
MKCGEVLGGADLFGGAAATALWGYVWGMFPDRLLKPRTDFRFEVCVSRLPAARGHRPVGGPERPRH